MNNERIDIHQVITDKLVAAMEAGAGAGRWKMPWVQPGGGIRPVNIASGNFYRGINVLALWIEAQERGYNSNIWGTFKQWKEKGASVRKGEKSAMIVFFKNFQVATDSGDLESRMVARATPVFNAAQVDGYTPPAPKVPIAGGAEALDGVDAFVANTGAIVKIGGSRAFYRPSTDEVHMPPQNAFHGSETSTPTEAYYGTLLHELVHWTGPKGRCERDLSGRFGNESYAMEELVAEIGAAFLCAELGVSAEPRADHAQYLASWLRVLKADKRAVFTAASKSSQAFDFLESLQRQEKQQAAA